MPKQYSSFLLRCWTWDGQVRIEVQHIQSGRRVRHVSFPAALLWLSGVAVKGDASDSNAMTRIGDGVLSEIPQGLDSGA